MADLLMLQDIHKSYNVGTPVETEVLHGIDLVLHSGEFVALMGPSGCGKSTLLNIIGLLDRPTSGRLYIAGEEATSLSETALTKLRGHTILLEWVGLGRWRNNRAMNMSGGQQQRVAVARALAMNPALVLADEPTGNLDTAAANVVFDLMRRFNQTRGSTFLVVTHNIELARRCDRIIEMIDGRVVDNKLSAHP